MSDTLKDVENAKNRIRKGKIPLPLCPDWKEFNEGYDDCLKKYKQVLDMRARIDPNVIRRAGHDLAPDPVELLFDTRSEHPMKLKLLTSIWKQLEKPLSEESKVRLRAREYAEMLFTIAAIKQLAADKTVLFNVPIIVEKTREQMEGEQDPSWEWITVHTEEEERTDVAAARSGATDPAERC